MAKLLYFANLVEFLGRDSETVALPEGVTDVRGMLAFLRARGGSWEPLFGENKVRVVVNKQFVNLDSKITDSADIAFIPMQF